MKGRFSRLAVLLFYLLLLLPVGSSLAFCVGYTLELASYRLYSAVLAVLSVTAAVYSLGVNEEWRERSAVMCSLLPLAGLICSVFCVFKLVAFAMLICVGCCFLSAAKSGNPFSLKATSLILSSLMILPVTFFVYIALTFCNLGTDEVVKSVDSPDSRYTAQIIDADQGTLGGETVVRVVKKRGLELLVLSVRLKPQTVYIGEWGEAEDITVYWSSDRAVTVNSYEYKIK